MHSLYYLAAVLTLALCILAISAYRNHREIERLRANGYRKLAFKRYNRGFVARDAMRGFAEFGMLLLLVIAVLGWMGFR